MDYLEKKKSRWVIWGRMVLHFFAFLGFLYVLLFWLYWCFFVRACMVDCVKNGTDEVVCRMEICVN